MKKDITTFNFNFNFNKYYIPINTIIKDISKRFKITSSKQMSIGFTNRIENIYRLPNGIIFTHTYNESVSTISFTKNGLMCDFENYPSLIQEDKITNYYTCMYQIISNGLSIPHRINGPAIITLTTSMKKISYYVEGKRHKSDGPAVIEENKLNNKKRDTSYKFIYYTNGKRNRNNDEPAQIYICGETKIEYWFKNGEKHRDNLPAVIETKKNKVIEQIYYKNGVIHRMNGPAIIQRNHKIYALYGSYMSSLYYKIFLFKLKHISIFKNLTKNGTLTNKKLLEIAEYHNYTKSADFLLIRIILEELD